MRLDPYINADTMNPFQHGKCSSPTTRARPTDLGHYERLSTSRPRKSNATTGSIYQSVLAVERR
jgi:CTP synthase